MKFKVLKATHKHTTLQSYFENRNASNRFK